MNRFSILVILAVLFALAACSASDSTSPQTNGGGTPDTTPKPKSGAACLQDLVGPAPKLAAAVHGASVDLPVLGTGPVPERFTAEVAERGGFAYTTTWGRRGSAGVDGNAVKVWDVRGTTPVLVDSLIVTQAGTTGDVQISDDGSVLVVPNELGENGLSIYSLANPAHPQFLTKFTSPDTRPGVHTVKLARVGTGLFAFLAIDPDQQQLVVLDLTEPANPKQLLARPMGNPFIHDTNIRDGILFTALWDDGLTAWDIGGCGQGGTPANPVSLVSYRTVAVDGTNPSVHNIWWLHTTDGAQRYVLVGEEQPIGQIGVASAGDIHVVDISDPLNPKEVAFFHVPNAGTHNFSVDEAHGVLYAAYYNGGVRAIDVRGDLSACSGSAKAADGRCDLAAEGRELGHALTGVPNVYVWGVRYDSGKIYVSDMVHGLYVLDASALTP